MSNRPHLVEEVADRIRELIEAKQLSAGDRLPSEVEMLAEHGVSRSVLREAINRLKQLGLVDVRHGTGMFVGDRDVLTTCLQFARSAMAITPHDLTQFGELRSALECWAARRAAEWATKDQVAELDELVDRLDERDRSYEDAIQLDFEFHRKLFEIADVPLVTNVIGVLQQFVLEGMLQTTPEPRDHDVSQELHCAVLEAIRVKNPEAAEVTMRRHMRVTIDRLSAHAFEKKDRQHAV